MTREKMTQMLSEAIGVTPDEAKAALEKREWSVPDAARLLQLERARAEKAEAARVSRRKSGWGKLAGALRGLADRLGGRRRLAEAR